MAEKGVKRQATRTAAWATLGMDQKIDLYRTMARIRGFETRVEQLFMEKKIPGFVHLYIGEEAIAAGIMANLRTDDYITSTHRGHGHAIAKGAKTDRMMAELFGKKSGYCKGKGGSMHIADFSVGMLGANGIVGGGYTIATGAALSATIRKTDQVAVCFFGDGASNRGTFHEAANLAAVWGLPVIFVNEFNRYASTTPASYGVSVSDIAIRAQGYGMPGVTVDGNDISEVYDAMNDLVARARRGEGPALLECKTYRVKGHFVGDPEKYRTRDEVRSWQSDNDPITRYRTVLAELDAAVADQLGAIDQEAKAEIDAAVAFAEAEDYPAPEEALEDLFTFSPATRPQEAN